MKIIIEDGPFSYQVDWAKEPLLEEGDIPSVEDSIESFLRLLENNHPKERSPHISKRESNILDQYQTELNNNPILCKQVD